MIRLMRRVMPDAYDDADDDHDEYIFKHATERSTPPPSVCDLHFWTPASQSPSSHHTQVIETTTTGITMSNLYQMFRPETTISNV